MSISRFQFLISMLGPVGAVQRLTVEALAEEMAERTLFPSEEQPKQPPTQSLRSIPVSQAALEAAQARRYETSLLYALEHPDDPEVLELFEAAVSRPVKIDERMDALPHGSLLLWGCEPSRAPKE